MRAAPGDWARSATALIKACFCTCCWLSRRMADPGVGGRGLGLAWAKLWVRRGKVTTGRRERPTAAKEARRWQDGITAAERVLAGAERVTVGSDREADICESWAQPRATNLHLLVRAAQNRSGRGGGSLFPACDRLTVAGRFELEVPRPPGAAGADGAALWQGRAVVPALAAPAPRTAARGCGSACRRCARGRAARRPRAAAAVAGCGPPPRRNSRTPPHTCTSTTRPPAAS